MPQLRHRGAARRAELMHHDGRGLTQSDFEKLNKSPVGLGLKNIQSRLKLLSGNIYFEKDVSQTYYKVTIELSKEEIGYAK